MKSAFFLFTLLFFLPFNLQAQEVAPIQLGNVWIYENDASLLRIEVVDTAVIIDSIQYFKVDLNYQLKKTQHFRNHLMKKNTTKRMLSLEKPGK